MKVVACDSGETNVKMPVPRQKFFPTGRPGQTEGKLTVELTELHVVSHFF